MYKLGDLSASYESNGDPGVIARTPGDFGGTSYGAWQFAQNSGIPQAFVDWAVSIGNEYGIRLSQYVPDTEDFDNEWKMIAEEDSEGFLDLQHDYVREAYYLPALEAANSVYVDVTQRSFALQNVIWSAAIQYGAGNISELLTDAAAAIGVPNASYLPDIDLIPAIYEVRGYCRSSNDWISNRNTDEIIDSLKNRFVNECNDAMELLKQEQG